MVSRSEVAHRKRFELTFAARFLSFKAFSRPEVSDYDARVLLYDSPGPRTLLHYEAVYMKNGLKSPRSFC